MAAAKANVYEMVTSRIIAELEKGNIPWEKPWTGVRSGAYNRISKKPYSIINQMLLQHTGEYATFKQWTDLGGHIRKGEKSEFVVFWKILEKEETNEDTGEKEVRKIPMLRYYNVFHISQVDGVEPLTLPFAEVEPIEAADKIMSVRAHLTWRESGLHEYPKGVNDDELPGNRESHWKRDPGFPRKSHGGSGGISGGRNDRERNRAERGIHR